MISIAQSSLRQGTSSTCIVAFIVLLPLVAKGSDAQGAEMGEWSGKASGNPGLCLFGVRKVTAQVSANNAIIEIMDGRSVMPRFSGTITPEGFYTTASFSFPNWRNDPVTSPFRAESTIQGTFFETGFLATLTSVVGRLGCTLKIFLLHGPEHGRRNIEFLESEVRAMERVAWKAVNPGGDSANKNKTSNSPLVERLRIVRGLLDDGLISTAEAAGKRWKILEEY